MARNITGLLQALENSSILKNVQDSTILLKKFSDDNNVLYVTSENPDEILKEYILVEVRVSEDLLKKRQQDGGFKRLGDVFSIHPKGQGVVYLGFENNGYLSPSLNSEEHLKVILKTLAEFQANRLRTGTVEVDVKSYVNKVLNSTLFKPMDKIEPSAIIEKVQTSLDKFYEDAVVVQSIGSVLGNNIFLKNSEECIFIEIEETKFRSPVYDALLLIFTLSDSGKFRQHHLTSLLKFYHRALIESLKKENSVLSTTFDEAVFEKHVRELLDVVKYEIASYFLDMNRDSGVMVLLDNIAHSITNPILNYEECLEAISNKLKSTDYDLVDYKLVPLQQKNGFLGDYFYLQAQVIHRNKKAELSIFVKLIKHVLKGGMELLSRKEQTFFYRFFVPLLEEYGLGDSLDFLPKLCYDRFNELIALEDLSELGFKTFKPSTRLSYDVEKTIIKSCAKLHGCSILLEELMSKKLGNQVRLNDLCGEYLKDFLYSSPQGGPGFMLTPLNKAGIHQYIDSCQDILEAVSKEDFLKKVDEIYDNVHKVVVNSQNSRNTVCHCDMFPGNVMVAFNNAGIASKSVIIDFQVVRYGPPVLDILFQLYISTDKKLRDKYKTDLLNEYYSQLKEILEKYNVDANSIYTKAELMESAKVLEATAIICVLIHSQYTAPCSGAEIEMFSPQWYQNESDTEHLAVKYKLTHSQEFNECIKELIQDLYQVLY